MDAETRRWLAPLYAALFATQGGAAMYVRSLESVVNEAHHGGPVAVDWVLVGQRIRDQLGWYDYPAWPPALETG